MWSDIVPSASFRNVAKYDLLCAHHNSRVHTLDALAFEVLLLKIVRYIRRKRLKRVTRDVAGNRLFTDDDMALPHSRGLRKLGHSFFTQAFAAPKPPLHAGDDAIDVDESTITCIRDIAIEALKCE